MSEKDPRPVEGEEKKEFHRDPMVGWEKLPATPPHPKGDTEWGKRQDI